MLDAQSPSSRTAASLKDAGHCVCHVFRGENGRSCRRRSNITPNHTGAFTGAVNGITSTPTLSYLTYAPEFRGTGTPSTKMKYHPDHYLRLVPWGAGLFAARIDIENAGDTEVLNLGVKVTGLWRGAFNLFVTTREAAPPNPPTNDRHLYAYPHDARNYYLLRIDIIFDPSKAKKLDGRERFVIYDHNAEGVPDEIAIPIGF